MYCTVQYSYKKSHWKGIMIIRNMLFNVILFSAVAMNYLVYQYYKYEYCFLLELKITIAKIKKWITIKKSRFVLHSNTELGLIAC